MIITVAPKNSLGIDNKIILGKDLCIDIYEDGGSTGIKLPIEKLKMLANHINDMIAQYEGKTNSGSA